MARHYSTREFFLQVPNALLKRYFDAKGVLAGFNFAAMTEAKIDPLFDAWKVLPETCGFVRCLEQAHGSALAHHVHRTA